MRWVSLSEWISACQWRLPQLFCWYVVNPPWDGWLIRICHFQISTVTTVVCTNKSTGWTANVLCRTRHNRTAVSVVLSYAHETHAVVEGFSARNRKWFGSLHWTTKWQVGQILLCHCAHLTDPLPQFTRTTLNPSFSIHIYTEEQAFHACHVSSLCASSWEAAEQQKDHEPTDLRTSQGEGWVWS